MLHFRLVRSVDRYRPIFVSCVFSSVNIFLCRRDIHVLSFYSQSRHHYRTNFSRFWCFPLNNIFLRGRGAALSWSKHRAEHRHVFSDLILGYSSCLLFTENFLCYSR